MKYSFTSLTLLAATASSAAALSARDLPEQEYLVSDLQARDIAEQEYLLADLQAREIAEQEYYNSLQARELLGDQYEYYDDSLQARDLLADQQEYYSQLQARSLDDHPLYPRSAMASPRFGLQRAERYAGKMQNAASGLNQAVTSFAPSSSYGGGSGGSGGGGGGSHYPVGGGSYAGYRRSLAGEPEFDLDEEILFAREAEAEAYAEAEAEAEAEAYAYAEPEAEAYAEAEAGAEAEARFGVGKIERTAAKIQTAAAGINQVIGGGASSASSMMGGAGAGADMSGAGGGGYAGYRRDAEAEPDAEAEAEAEAGFEEEGWEEDGLYARWEEEDEFDAESAW